jgi:hypothetical protein
MQASGAPDATLRLTASRARLVRTAIGGPRQIAGKLRRLGRTLWLWLHPREIDARLARLEARGYVAQRPTRLQLLFGSLDMLRFVIEPASRDYYRQRGIDFGLHQLLRWLDDPCSLVDPTGFFSDRDTIMGHVMQVVHLNPVYDLQLLQMFPDGLEVFEREIEAMIAGTHPRAGTIGAIVEEPGYHARLLDYVRRYRRDPRATPPVRESQALRADARFAAAERTFATLPGFIAYCNALPRDLRTLRRRLRALDAFPVELEQAPVYR